MSVELNRNIRIGVYVAVIAVMLVLLVLGQVDGVQVSRAVETAAMLLGVSGGGLALANLTPRNTVSVAVGPEVVSESQYVGEEPAPWLKEG